MTVLVKLCGVSILAAAALTVLRGAGKNAPFFVSAAAGVVILAGVIPSVAQIAGFVKNASERAGLTEYASVLLRAAGLAAVTDITARLCRSSGEEHVASFVELAGKCEILALSLPYISQILTLSLGLLGR
ncbi:MAG: hypothetical protein II736_01590 [Clostridia bacterium]|nr:hypothetical protein [Clostridia bacterium]